MECIRYKKQIYYAAKGDLNGKGYNRRGEYRLFIGENVNVRIGDMIKERFVVLKDISNSGFAFVYEGEISDAIGMFVTIKYLARIEGKAYELTLAGRVVREMAVTDTKKLYGCALLKRNKMIGQYINQRQMEQLAEKNERFTNVDGSSEQ